MGVKWMFCVQKSDYAYYFVWFEGIFIIFVLIFESTVL